MKTIGVVGWKLGENSFGVTVPYLDWLSSFGDVQILMPSKIMRDLDLLVLPGGMDLNPSAYGEVPSYYTSNIDVHKQWFYENMLPQYIDAGVPVFGVCLGMQQLAAYFGSKITQNLIDHPYSKERHEEAHKMKIQPEGYKYYKPEKASMGVNSLHHQGVLLNELSGDLIPLAVADSKYYDFGIVEAFEHRDKPVAAVQYHPEEYYDYFAGRIIARLLDWKKKGNQRVVVSTPLSK